MPRVGKTRVCNCRGGWRVQRRRQSAKLSVARTARANGGGRRVSPLADAADRSRRTSDDAGRRSPWRLLTTSAARARDPLRLWRPKRRAERAKRQTRGETSERAGRQAGESARALQRPSLSLQHFYARSRENAGHSWAAAACARLNGRQTARAANEAR